MPVLEPDCDDCMKAGYSIRLPCDLNDKEKCIYIQSKWWNSDIVDAFFVGVAHSVTCHSDRVVYLKTFHSNFCSQENKYLCQLLVQRDVHYYLPYLHESSPDNHFILLHFFDDTLNVHDPNLDRSNDIGRVMQKRLIELLVVRYRKIS